MKDTNKQISCSNVCIQYDGNIASKDVTFTVEKGDYICIVGENGSGKSTLIKGLLGIIPISKGKITFFNGLTKKDIGYLSQQTMVQKDFPASVYEVVLSGAVSNLGFKCFYNKKDKKLAKDNIKRLNITSIMNKSYMELSGGQQQRVLLARALCATKKILVLDEPITGLDPKTTKDMYKIIKELNEEGITIIMVCHDLNFAINNANKILHMHTKQEFFGYTKDYLKSEVGKAFLGGDYDA